MRDFKHWGIKIRSLRDYNYKAMWYNLKTVRFGESVDDIIELPPSLSEFYDVAITSRCNAYDEDGNSGCKFCYVSASNKGIDYVDICEIWKAWMDQYPEDEKRRATIRTSKPFQIAIGE